MKFKLFFLILFYLIPIINCVKLELTDITFNDLGVSTPYQHNGNPDDLTGVACSFYLMFYAVGIEDTINMGEAINFTSENYPGVFFTQLSNKTAKIAQYDISIPIGSTILDVTALYESAQTSINVTLNCHENDFSKITVKVFKNSIDFSPLFHYPALVKLQGPFYNNIRSISAVGISYGFNSFLVFTTQPYFIDSFNITIEFINSNALNITIPQFFEYNINNDIVFNKFPNQTQFNEIGRYYSPLYTISSSGNLPIYRTNSENSANPKAIYGSPNNLTFIGSVMEPDSNKNFFVQTLNGNKFENISINLFTTINAVPFYRIPLLADFTFSTTTDLSTMFTAYYDSSSKYDFSTIKYTLKEYTLKLAWPFGFENGNNLGHKLIVSFPFSNYSSQNYDTFGISVISGSSSGKLIPVNMVTPNPPEILSFEIIYLYDFNLLVKVKINSNVSYECEEFSYIEIIGEKFGYEKCVSDEDQNPSFEIFVNSWNSFQFIEIINLCGYKKTYDIGSFVGINPPKRLMLPLLMTENDIFSIENVTFLYNNVNVIDKSVSNLMSFNYSDVTDTRKPFGLYILDETSGFLNKYDEKSVFFSKWNPIKKMFEIEFFVKANSREGVLPWMLTSGNNYASLINSFLPLSCQLFINQSKFDAYGPIFTNITKTSSYGITQELLVDWEFHIRDEINGFERGYIEIRGDFDSSKYTFTFTNANLRQGDIYNGVYIYSQIISLNSKCNIQNYTITNVELYDRFGNSAKFSTSSERIDVDPTRNPFILFGDDPNINKFQTDCNDTVDDYPPKLLSFTFENKMETTQSILFSFSVQSTDSGIKFAQLPIVYATSRQFKTIQCISGIGFYNITYASYSCHMEIPFGFGFKNEILFSVYGFINNGGYFSGFSTEYLKTNSFPYSISNIPLYRKLSIVKTSSITNKGGDLWIIGREFDQNSWVFVQYVDGQPNDSLIPKEIHSTAILVSRIKPTIHPFAIQVRHITNGTLASLYYTVYPLNFIYPEDSSSTSSTSSSSTSSSFSSSSSSPSSSSNETTPSPTSLPTNAPQKCKGNPICGGSNGYCSSSGCVCYSPWVGEDCLSKVIIVPQPSTNTSQPSTEIPIFDNDDNNNSESIMFKSLISIVSLRELDFNDKQVNQYIFDKWTYSKLNETTNQYFTNITIQPSASNNFKSSITNITATLQWYNKETNITFANEQLQMKPSSIKYTIEISQYKFSNALNKLQLVMSASLTSFKGDDNICSFNKFGETTNGDDSEYIKIQVDNHSLYGRFIKRALIDLKIRSISNVQLDSSFGNSSSSTSSSSQLFIGIDIPIYNDNVIIDPDFSVLIDSKAASNGDDNSICSSSKSKLSKTQLAGIIIGSILFGLIVIVAITGYIINKRKNTKMINRIQNKLKRVNK
ncbi:hypothetical protein ACTFIY_004266 [Dictyostelium cf. discoideum]